MCVMVAGKLSETETLAMLADWHAAAPAGDGALVELLCRWAARGRHTGSQLEVWWHEHESAA